MTANLDQGNKSTLRKMLRQGRNQLSNAAQENAAHGLLTQLLKMPEFNQSHRVATYLSNDGEIDPKDVIDWLQQNNRNSFVPMVRQEQGRNWLMFAEIKADTVFVNNRFGIAEPVVPESEWVPADTLDLVLLPLVGFDRHGNRIGMGGGFYDTTFEFVAKERRDRPVLVGIAHEIQRVENIDAESWDIPLSTVVTDQHVYRLKS